MSNRGAKIWRDRVTHETKGGWWFSYIGADNEVTENGPFETYDEADDELHRELEELFVELEGEM